MNRQFRSYTRAPRRSSTVSASQLVSLFTGVLLLFFFLFVPKNNESLALGGPAAEDAGDGVVSEVSLSSDGFIQKSAVGYEKSNLKDITEPFAYTVQEGDDLQSIAEEFGLDTETLVSNNRSLFRQSREVHEGQILRIPPVSGVIHTIHPGDTVDSLADKYGVDAEVIRRQNHLSYEDTLIDGRELIIPGGKIAEAVVETPKPVVHSAYRPRPVAPKQSPDTSSSYVAAKGLMLFPTNGKISQYYHRGHYAIDIANREMPDILAARDGVVRVVETAGWNGGYGKHVIIDHGNGIETLYAHMSAVSVTEGTKIKKGEKIGVMGRTGRSTGIHLHFEVIQDGYQKNPMAYF